MSATIRPVLTEYDLGTAGWRKLHELAHQRCRKPSDQVLQLVRYALERALAGEDVELSQSSLDSLTQAA
jgi:hypothetical protein